MEGEPPPAYEPARQPWPALPGDRRGGTDQLPLADRYFLAAVDEVNGAPRLHRAALTLGLAGGLVAEQILAGRVDLRDGLLTALPTGQPCEDALSEALVDRLRRTHPHPPVRAVLRGVSETVYAEVGRRLVGQYLVTPLTVRGRLRRRRDVVFVPTDPDGATAGLSLIVIQVTRMQPMNLAERVLAGLVRASGLVDLVTWTEDGTAHLRQLISGVEAGLPPPLRDLLAAVEAAVATTVATGRR